MLKVQRNDRTARHRRGRFRWSRRDPKHYLPSVRRHDWDQPKRSDPRQTPSTGLVRQWVPAAIKSAAGWPYGI